MSVEINNLETADRAFLLQELVSLQDQVTQLQQEISETRVAQQQLQTTVDLYGQILDAIPTLVLCKAEHSKIVYGNRAFRDYYGMTQEQLQGLIDSPVSAPDHTQKFIQDDTYVFTTGQTLDIPIEPVTRYDGEVRWFHTVKSAIRDPDGHVIYTVGVSTDITEQRQTAQQLRQSEERLQKLADNLPGMLYRFQLNPDGTAGFSYVSAFSKEIYGLEPEAVIQQESGWIQETIHPDEREQFNQSIATSIETLYPWQWEGRVRSVSGQYQWVQAISKPERQEDGRIIWDGLLLDASDRKIAELALAETAERQALLNQLSNQIRHSLDLDTVIQTTIQSVHELLEIDLCCFAWYNPETEPATWEVVQAIQPEGSLGGVGIYPASLVGPVSEIVQQEVLCIEDVETYAEPIHRQFLQTLGLKSELLIPMRTSSEKIGVIICGHLQSVRVWADGEIELLRLVTDQLAIATEQAVLYAQSQAKQVELEKMLTELQQTQSRLIQSEKMSGLGQLVAGVAHEINNPVNFIYGNLSHANDYTQDLLGLLNLYQEAYPEPILEIQAEIDAIDLQFLLEDLPKLLSSMRVGAERIQQIVRSLRNFSRMDEAEFKAVDLHEGIDSTLMILQHRLKDKPEHPAIEVIKEYGDLPLVECYAGQLNQVFMNILSNAIDALEERDQARSFAEAKQNPSKILILTEQDNDRVRIRIRDNGPGIPEQVQSRLFDPFFTTKGVGKGTGLGMSISYQIVTEKHEGQLYCVSVPGEGAEFVIDLPLRQTVG